MITKQIKQFIKMVNTVLQCFSLSTCCKERCRRGSWTFGYIYLLLQNKLNN